MLGVTDIWTYVLGTIAIILLPGPNSLYVLSVAARRGRAAGYRAAGGRLRRRRGADVLVRRRAWRRCCAAYPPLFMVIKYAGAAYLGYVGVTMLRRRGARAGATGDGPSTPRRARRRGAGGGTNARSAGRW